MSKHLSTPLLQHRPGPQGLLVSALLGGIVTAVTLSLWALVATLGSSLVFSLPLLPLAAAGILPGCAVVFIRWRVPRATPWASWIAGALLGGPWVLAGGFLPAGLSLQAAPALAVQQIVAFALAGRLTAGVLRGVPSRGIRKDHLETVAVRLLRSGGLIFFVWIVVFPFLFMVSSSLKSRADYLRDPINLGVNLLQSPEQLFHGYIQVLGRFNFGRYILNSSLIAVATVFVALVPAILGAYAVTRLRFPGRTLLSKSILLIYMFPAIVLVIPLYSVFTQLGLRDTRFGLLIVYAAMTIPVALYMLRSYFQSLPADLEEAGLIDGLTRLGVIWRITIPLSMPAIASVGLYVFMIAWNEFLFAFMFLDTPEIFTLSRGMIMLDDQEVPRQFLMAGATVITVPIMILFFRFQRLLVGGLTAGSVKG
ncbi:carbohydrate ABC transporter membrane protein 2, CUT1 family [Alkalispirochaeta americana]|uniref:Carbohydrate ABC transporter membrane protein 2, CUT1 family n=1 Tax=Alkalispirochaeta americana TaxID=159291 RepID=A0A1N6WM84_9SPIO|nr:carbohydrate ABC transporter permease [Alkalispirochaeta americana]SIQ91140.1 carbohydrate ABC transporter membrane protein 2, CUT1 family [Alkalispirochaeta americana]